MWGKRRLRWQQGSHAGTLRRWKRAQRWTAAFSQGAKLQRGGSGKAEQPHSTPRGHARRVDGAPALVEEDSHDRYVVRLQPPCARRGGEAARKRARATRRVALDELRDLVEGEIVKQAVGV